MDGLDPLWLKPRQERPKRRGLIGALRKETNLKCLILTCLIYGCVLAIVWCRVTRVTKVDIDYNAFPITSSRQVSPCDDGYIYIPSAFVVMLYLLYLIECWHCKAWVQLRFEKTDVNSAYRIIQEMKQAQPLVWWKAVCYHYVRRTRETARIHNGDSYPATQVYYERVNSHLAAGCFYFGYCGMRDISPEILDLEKYAATKIRLSKGFLFANLAAAQEFEEQRASFFQDHERYDDYLEMKEGLDLSTSSSSGDFKENVISWANPDNLPWFGRSTVFWISNLLLLSWPLRLILELNTAHVHYQVNKLFGSNYVTPLSPLSDLITSGNYRSRNQNQRRPRPQRIRTPLQNHFQLQRRNRRHDQSQPGSEPSAVVPRAAENSPLISEEQEGSSESQPLVPLYEKPEKEFCGEKDGMFSGSRDETIGFPSYFHVRNSNRNPLTALLSRHTSRSRIPRSVTLLMTKGERREFSRFGFNYFDEDRIIRENSPEFPEETGGILSNSSNSPSSSINNSNSNSSGLAPTYSQALLLMEPMNGDLIDSRSSCRSVINQNQTLAPLDSSDNNNNNDNDHVGRTMISDHRNSLVALAGNSCPNEGVGLPGNCGMESAARPGSGDLMMVTEGTNHQEDGNIGNGGGGAGNIANFSETGGGRDHYRRTDSATTTTASSIRNSSLVLNSLAPRTMPGVPIDLTQPVVMTVPNDPRSSTRVDSPPSYEEALRTSRPVFLPTWARIRRCFTERDIHSRFFLSSSSSNSNVWLQDDREELSNSKPKNEDEEVVYSRVDTTDDNQGFEDEDEEFGDETENTSRV